MEDVTESRTRTRNGDKVTKRDVSEMMIKTAIPTVFPVVQKKPRI